MAALCMLFKIKSNPMHPLSGALPLPYVPTRVTRGALVAHRYSFAPPRCRISQSRRTFVPLSVFLWNDLGVPVFAGVISSFFLSPRIFSFSSFHGLIVWGCGLRIDRVFSLSPDLALPTLF